MKKNPNDYHSVKEATKRWVSENPEKVRGYKARYNDNGRKQWLKTKKGKEYLERNKLRNKEIKEENLGFAENLKALRKERGLTQKQMAEEIGIKQPNYCKWEKGVFIPSSLNLQKIAEILGISYNELIKPLGIVEEKKNEEIL